MRKLSSLSLDRIRFLLPASADLSEIASIIPTSRRRVVPSIRFFFISSLLRVYRALASLVRPMDQPFAPFEKVVNFEIHRRPFRQV